GKNTPSLPSAGTKYSRDISAAGDSGESSSHASIFNSLISISMYGNRRCESLVLALVGSKCTLELEKRSVIGNRIRSCQRGECHGKRSTPCSIAVRAQLHLTRAKTLESQQRKELRSCECHGL